MIMIYRLRLKIMLKSTPVPPKSLFNSLKPLYLVFTIVGTVVPWYWLLQDPTALLSPSLFLQKTFANNISTTWANDLVISAIVFFCFAWTELKRLRISRLWLILYIGLTIGVGLCCSLPLFLYRREHQLEQN